MAEEKRFYCFPNIEPTIAVIESLGFEMKEWNYGQPIFTKTIAGRVCELGLFHETACWDVSDNTFLEFRWDQTPWRHSIHGSLHFLDGFYMGTAKVPTAEQIKQAISYKLKSQKATAEEKLRTAYRSLQEAYAAYEIVSDLGWED